MKAAITLVLVLVSSGICVAQQAKQTDKPIIFAVLNSGGTLEPIAYIEEDNVLAGAIDGAQEPDMLSRFHARYFKPKAAYQLVFGGANSGTVTVKSSDPSAECERHTAKVSVISTRTALKGNVMALAVSQGVKIEGSGVRRAPTPLERSEIDSLVREEFAKNKVSAAALKKLRAQNLTAIDVDKDDIVEFVGSYWVQPTPKSRSLLFFIARKGSDDYELVLTDFGTIKEEDTMSNDITAVDTGIGHELLIDFLDLDGDGTAEIFTYEASFEGAGFNVYRRQAGKWTRIFEGVNYRCAF